MTAKELSNGIVRAVVTLAVAALALYLLYQIRNVLIYIIVAIIISMIGFPIVAFLKKKLKFGHTAAVLTTLFFFIGLITGFVMLFVPLIITQSEKLSLLDMGDLQLSFKKIIIEIDRFLQRYNIDIMVWAENLALEQKNNLQFIPNLINSIFSVLSNLGMGIASVTFISFFLLKDKAKFQSGFKKILPFNQSKKILDSIEKTNQMLSRYFGGLMLQLFIVFVLYFIVLLIFGVESAFTIALLCAILNIIPYIGPLIGTVLAVFLTMMSNINANFNEVVLPKALYVLLGFTIVQLIDNNLNQPFIFSNSTKSHPLEIFIVTLCCGFLFGITGMIIAIPTYTVLKVLAKTFYPNNKVVKLLTKDL